MRRFFVAFSLLFLSFYCFSQQNLPSRIIGGIPNPDSTKTYQIQVGAYRITQNAENIFYKLKIGGFEPVYENYFDLTRVMITGIPARQIPSYLELIKMVGFNEVIVREDRGNTISEKWNITTAGSSYASFEFNQDKNYIAIENPDETSGETRPIVHFGEYNMPAKDIIEMVNLGTLRINANSKSGIDLSFAPINEPEKVQSFEAVKEASVPKTPEAELFCRSWKIVKATESMYIGYTILFSNAGTYLVTRNDSGSFISSWRWYDERREEFEYSHDNWKHYGRAQIKELKQDSLKFNDPGYYTSIEGYSSGDKDDLHELEPVNR